MKGQYSHKNTEMYLVIETKIDIKTNISRIILKWFFIFSVPIIFIFSVQDNNQTLFNNTY